MPIIVAFLVAFLLVSPAFGQAFEWDTSFAIHGTRGYIDAACVTDSGIVIGYEIPSINRTRVNGLALWNGNEWKDAGHLLAPGMYYNPDGLFSDGRRLFISGHIILRNGTVGDVVELTGDSTKLLPRRTLPPDPQTNGSTMWRANHRLIAYRSWNAIVVLRDTGWEAVGKFADAGTPDSRAIFDFALSGDTILVAGQFDSVNGQSISHVALYDGTQWHSLGAPNNPVRRVGFANGELYVGGAFDSIGAVETKNAAIWDGLTWRPMIKHDATFRLQSGFSSMVNVSGKIYVSGLQQGTPSTGIFGEVANGEIKALPGFGLRLLEWRGQVYSADSKNLRKMSDSGFVDVTPVNGPYLGQEVSCWSLAALGETLVLAGPSYPHITFLYDGKRSELPIQPQSHADVVVASNQKHLYFGGQFRTMNSQVLNGIARYNDGSWEAMGIGLGNRWDVEAGPEVRRIVIRNDELYVSGNFDTAGGKFAWATARWNGSEWLPLDNEQIGIDALGFVSDTLIFGAVVDAVNLKKTFLAYWNGDKILPWPQLPDGGVFAMLPYKNGFVIGGDFDSVGSIAARGVAYWDGTRWNPLDTGLPPYIRAIAFDGERLFAGGREVLSYWDAGEWHPTMASTKNIDVRALHVFGDKLYVAGSFIRLGEVPSFNIGALQLPERAPVREDRSQPKALTLSPNPASTMVRVVQNGFAKGSLLVVDLLGRVVLRSNQTVLDVSALPEGRYLVATEFGSAPLEIRRF